MRYYTLLILILLTGNVLGCPQMCFLRFNFSNTGLFTPPPYYEHVAFTSTVNDVWHFGKAGSLPINYPVTNPGNSSDKKNTLKERAGDDEILVYLNPFAPLCVVMNGCGKEAKGLYRFFREGKYDIGINGTNVYKNFGTYQVMPTGYSGKSYCCIGKGFRNIVVDTDVKTEAPSLITHNKGGYDDYFEIYTFGVRELKANIYNWWGRSVNEIPGIGSRCEVTFFRRPACTG